MLDGRVMQMLPRVCCSGCCASSRRRVEGVGRDEETKTDSREVGCYNLIRVARTRVEKPIWVARRGGDGAEENSIRG